MYALARKGMSSAEMTALLESREIDADSIVEEIDRLEGVGLLDDKALAETLVRTLQDRKGLGRSAINAELRRRKIDADTISEALESVDVDDELARAIELAQKRASQLRSYDHETAKRRLSGYLMRRGYSGSVVSAAIAASLGAPGRTSGGSGPRFS
jgi:SOS response regulatory protein OraA/RecX